MTDLVEPRFLKRLELLPASAEDRYFDYCLEPYRPRRPWRGKLRAENLLWCSLRLAGAEEGLAAPLRAVQEHLGRDLTVWGVKWDGRALWWELYFYDPRREAPEARLGPIAEALRPWVRVEPGVPESIPYMMVSFDLFPETAREGSIPEVNLYLTGETTHSGRAYKVKAGSMELENTYRFIEPKRDVDQVLPLLTSSVFVDYTSPPTLSKVLVPELFACKKVCIAKKRTCDAIYYSGIAVDQLQWFLRRFAYPDGLRRFVDRHAEAFEHLYFDVGLDYRRDASGAIVFPKTSFYGTL